MPRRRRLTRKEQQAHTRLCLMRSASRVFARHGLHQASINDVAAAAGFTKGAFYANFKSKEELFLAMLDQRFAARLESLDRILASEHEVEQQAREGGEDFFRHISADPEWQRLFFEFAAYAARNDDFRAELLARYRSLRARIVELYRTRVERLDGVAPPLALEQVALMTFAMANGIALEQLLEPDVVDEQLFATMLMVFFAGLRALSEAGAAV
jgi:AcrR family transcriptional regulator